MTKKLALGRGLSGLLKDTIIAPQPLKTTLFYKFFHSLRSLILYNFSSN